MFSGIFLNFWDSLMLKKEESPYWKFRMMQISLGWQEMCQLSKEHACITYIWASKQTKNNLGRKPLAASASGKLVKSTLGCHSRFGIRKFLLPTAEMTFIYQRDHSLQTWINIDWLYCHQWLLIWLLTDSVFVHHLWLLQKTFEHILCFL